ncbi:MAG: 30S ribosomal protein S20, partial [Candidatus Binatia bacterium]
EITVAIHPSVIKRHRQSLKRKARNQEIKSRLRTLMKKAKRTIETRDRDNAALQIKEVNRALGKAVSKGALKSNTAARWMSRLARSLNTSAA